MSLRKNFAFAFAAALAVIACSGKDTSPSGGGGGAGANGGGGSAAATGGGGSGGSVPVECRPSAAEPTTPKDAPVSFWVSQPLRPDETALVTGGNFTASAKIEAAIVPDCDPGSPLDPVNVKLAYDAVKPIYVSTTGAQFVIPSAWRQGMYAYRISDSGKTGARTFINKPDVWSVQGDVGGAATPGGFLELHGTSLGSGKTSRAVLVRSGKVVKTLRADASDKDNGDYRERFMVPSDVAEGDYDLYVHNGFGGVLGWTRFSTFIQAPLDKVTIARRAVWPSKIVDVTKQAGADDDTRFAAAIAALAANKGGVLYAPAGSYSLTKQLALPHHTLLRGDGKAKTTLTWTANPVDALVTGAILQNGLPNRGTFSVEDIAIVGSATFIGYGIERMYSADPAWIRRTSVKLPYIGQQNDAVFGVFLETCTSTEITDSELDARRSIFAREGVAYLRIENDVLDWRDATMWYSSLDHGLIFAHNTLNLRGNAETNTWANNPNPGFAYTSFYGTRIGGPYTKDLYYAYNKSQSDEVQPTTGFITTVGYTSDGATGIYIGKFTNDGTTLTLAGTTTDPGIDMGNGMPITYDFSGGIAMIVDGRGIGQWRYLAEAKDRSNTVKIDRAWDVEPDATSTVNIVNLQGRSLFIGNEFNLEYTNQEYASSLDIIRAGNHFPIGGSWTFIGKPYTFSTFVTPWHFQMLDNQFTSPTSNNGVQNLVTILAYPDPEYSGVAASGIIYRNNVYATPGMASIGFYTKLQPINDSLMEKNTVGSIYLGQNDDTLTFDGMVMRKNKASYSNGILSGKDLTKLPGIYYVP